MLLLTSPLETVGCLTVMRNYWCLIHWHGADMKISSDITQALLICILVSSQSLRKH